MLNLSHHVRTKTTKVRETMRRKRKCLGAKIARALNAPERECVGFSIDCVRAFYIYERYFRLSIAQARARRECALYAPDGRFIFEQAVRLVLGAKRACEPMPGALIAYVCICSLFERHD